MLSLLTQEELETPRSAAEMLNWVHSVRGRFEASEEFRKGAREGKFFAKELLEEAFPIALFAHRFYNASHDVLITHVIGNQTYDAVVEDRRDKPSPVKYIEVTSSHKSHDEALRMEALNMGKIVGAYGPIRVNGPRGKRTLLEAPVTAVLADDLCQEHIEKVRGAINMKMSKTYPPGTALVIFIDDFLPFRRDKDIQALDEMVGNLARSLSGCKFEIIALEGPRDVHKIYEI